MEQRQPTSRRSAAIRAKLDAKPGAVSASLPSAPGVTLYKIMGKMFAILSVRKTAFVILKSDPHLAEVLRQQYAGIGHRSHLDKRFWISVDLDADVPASEIKHLIDRSYDLIAAALTRKQKAELEALAPKKSRRA